MGFSAIGMGNHSHKVVLDILLHVDAMTDKSKLPWHKYLKDSSPKQPSLQPSHYIYIYIYMTVQV